MEAECEVTYACATENNYLRMEWTRGDHTVINSTTVASKHIPFIFLFKVRSFVRFKVKVDDDRLQLNCYTYFVESNQSMSSDPFHIKATNAPDYTHMCVTPPLNVQCKYGITLLSQNKKAS